MRIAVDAMGGDNAPGEIIRGAIEGLEIVKDATIALVGPEQVVRNELSRYDGWQDRIEIVHASQIIGMDDSPIDALRLKRDSSISVAVKMVAEGRAEACISAGNTGAFVGACQLKLKKIPGVGRGGIAAVIPSFFGPLVLCDVGANISPRPDHLYQYGIMACVYSTEVLGIKNPRVGIISIGEEDVKGTDLVKSAAEYLKADSRINFIGNVEGRDLFRGVVDVVVCDGFVGNVILKMTEGLAEGLISTIGRELAEEAPEMTQRFEPVVKKIWARHDYSEHGGAPLLGVNGVCIICHGSSGHRAIKNAVRVTGRYIQQNLNEIIAEGVARSVGVPA